MSPFLLLSLLGGVLAVDERAGWQSLLAQPVFCALVVGAITGELSTALGVGVLLELVWLSILPMRGLKRPDTVAGAVVGCGSASLLVHLTADPRSALVIGTGVFLGLLAAGVSGRLLQRVWDLQNRFLSQQELDTSMPPSNVLRRLNALNVGSLAVIFVVETIMVGLLLRLGYPAAEVLTRIVGSDIQRGVESWAGIVAALGAAALIHVYWHRHLKRVLILSAVMVVLVLWLN